MYYVDDVRCDERNLYYTNKARELLLTVRRNE